MIQASPLLRTLVFCAILPMLPCHAGELTHSGDYWEWHHQMSMPMSSGGSLRIENLAADVEISSWDSPDIAIEETRYFDVYTKNEAEILTDKVRTEIRKTDNRINIKGKSGPSHKIRSELDIFVPRQIDLILNIRAGSLAVEDVNGSLAADLGGGEVELDQVSGPVDLNLGGGDVEITGIRHSLVMTIGGGNCEIASCTGGVTLNLGGGEVEMTDIQGPVNASLGGGEVEISNVKGNLTFTSGGGDIELNRIRGDIQITLGGGSIDIGETVGELQVKNSGGELELNDIEGPTHAETTGGDITVSMLLNHPELEHSLFLKTLSGDIEVQIPGSLKATVMATINKAGWHQEDIVSDFKLFREVEENRITASGTLNGGGDAIELLTKSGEITILRSE